MRPFQWYFQQEKNRNIFKIFPWQILDTSLMIIIFLITRIWWIVIFLASIAMCTHLIMKTYNKWQSSPVIVSFAQSPTPVWQVPFPAVTICSETKARQSVFNFTEYYHLAVGGSLENMTEAEWVGNIQYLTEYLINLYEVVIKLSILFW